jgi:DNA-binding NarL/FixJ family response regulator
VTEPRLLLVGGRQKLPASPSHGSSKPLLVEISSAVTDAIQKVSEEQFDAIVCWTEGQQELAGLIRIRKAVPQVPIVVVTSQDDSEFEILARQMGATRTLRASAGMATILESVRIASQNGELARELLAQSQESQRRANEVRLLAQETRSLVQEARDERRKRSTVRFLPLVVEDDPDQALLTIRAFERAKVPAPLPILKSAEEAIQYLSGGGEFADRDRYPLPTIVLLDLGLQRKSGFEVLEWIRSRPEFGRLKVAVLSASTLSEHINRAYESKADAFFTKPTSFNAFIEFIRSLERHWGRPQADPEL